MAAADLGHSLIPVILSLASISIPLPLYDDMASMIFDMLVGVLPCYCDAVWEHVIFFDDVVSVDTLDPFSFHSPIEYDAIDCVKLIRCLAGIS